jgi:hypothetical protein
LSLEELTILLKELEIRAEAQGHVGGLHDKWCSGCQAMLYIKQLIYKKENKGEIKFL